MTTLPRAATSPELVKIRAENQSSRIYLTVHQPATVFTARLAAVPASTDNVSSITYDTGSGAGYTSIIVGQTMYVGTTAGAYDLGMVRIRTLSGLGATTGTFNIGLTSEIAWSSACYLTVVDAWDIWPRSPFGDAMDFDVSYSDQHSHCASIPIYPRYHVKWLTGATVTVVLDGTQSWTLGNSITNYSWSAPGNSAISGDSTNTCTITYNAVNKSAGYRVALEITNSDNVDSQGYGRVFVLGSESDAITQFRVDSLEGSYSNGGWSAQITLWGSDADRTSIRDRALCILHRRDWYGLRASDEGSIGYITGDENIEMVGWIAGESIRWSPHWNGEESVTFVIQGPQYWLNKLTMPAVGLKNISSHPPTNWKRFMGLTAKSATWHILYWRTTAPACIDCFPIDNNWGALQLQGSGAQTVWQQLNTILNDFIIAKPCCDAYGRLFMQVEQNLLPAATRSSIPTVMTVTTGDWQNQIDFERREVLDVAAVDFSGDVYNGTTSTPTYALSPGRTIGSRGSSVFIRDRLVLIDQATTNALAGAAMGWKNNPYPKWKFQLPSNMHLIDLAPYQYLATDIVTSDTQRGISATGLRLIPRTIRRVFNDGVITTEVDIEAETPIYMSVTGDTPPAPPIISVTPPPLPPPPPPPVPTPTGNAREKWFATEHVIVWAGDYNFTGASQPTWTLATGLPSFGTITWFGISSSGIAYLCTDGVTGSDKFWRSATPKTGGWVQILANNDPIYPPWHGKSFNKFQVTNNAMSTTVLAVENNAGIHAVYNNGAWSYHLGGAEAGGALFDSYVDNQLSAAYLKNLSAGTISGWVKDFGTPSAGQSWQNNIGGARYTISSQSTQANLINMETGAVAFAPGLGDGSNARQYYVTGALRGPHVYFVTSTGHCFVSSDGAAFLDVATWGPGMVWDSRDTGGGELTWTLTSVGANNEFDRTSLNRGSTWTAMTGNFWSLVSGNQVFTGSGLVYG